MIKLELKHLAPYLPYGLNFKGVSNTYELTIYNFKRAIPTGKPILRPLSGLTEKNKREILKSGIDFLLTIYDDDSTTPIVQSKLEKFGTGPIGELASTTTPSIRNKTTV